MLSSYTEEKLEKPEMPTTSSRRDWGKAEYLIDHGDYWRSIASIDKQLYLSLAKTAREHYDFEYFKQ